MVALYSPVTPPARVGGAPHSFGLPEEQEVTGFDNSCIIDMQQLAIAEHCMCRSSYHHRTTGNSIEHLPIFLKLHPKNIVVASLCMCNTLYVEMGMTNFIHSFVLKFYHQGTRTARTFLTVKNYWNLIEWNNISHFQVYMY